MRHVDRVVRDRLVVLDVVADLVGRAALAQAACRSSA
jgi:hypothetical protein